MDNLTHALTGLLLARAAGPLHARRPWAVTAVAVVAANLPDIDVVSLAAGPQAYLAWHRHATHSLLLWPALAALPVLAARLLGKLDWRRAYLLSLVALGSHLLLDWTNAYPTFLFWPFSRESVEGDITFVVDYWIWAMAITAVIAPWFSRLVASEIGAKSSSARPWAIAMLLAIGAYDSMRWVLHQTAVTTIGTRIYGGQNPRRWAAYPEIASPLRWRGVVETDSAYATVECNVLLPFSSDDAQLYPKPELAAIRPFASDGLAHDVQAFAAFPFWRLLPSRAADVRRAELIDLRFGDPAAPGGVVVVSVDDQGRVKESRMEYR